MGYSIIIISEENFKLYQRTKGILINNGLDPYKTNKDLNIEKLAKIVEEMLIRIILINYYLNKKIYICNTYD